MSEELEPELELEPDGEPESAPEPEVDSGVPPLPPEKVISGLTVSVVKQYLRVDFHEDDFLMETFLLSAEKTCLEMMRTTSKKKLEKDPNGRVAMLHTVAYLYENRENADMQELNRTLRALLGGSRKEVF